MYYTNMYSHFLPALGEFYNFQLNRTHLIYRVFLTSSIKCRLENVQVKEWDLCFQSIYFNTACLSNLVTIFGLWGRFPTYCQTSACLLFREIYSTKPSSPFCRKLNFVWPAISIVLIHQAIVIKTILVTSKNAVK